jgi:ankyrin repeat protein
VVAGTNGIVGQYLVIVPRLKLAINTMQSIVSVSNYMDKLSSIFMDIGRSAPRHQAMAVLYSRSTKLQAYLSEYFVVVVDLCRYLFRFAQKSTLKQFTSSLSDAALRTYQTELDRWAQSIEKEMHVSEAQESHGFRSLSRSVFNSASHQQKLATKNRVLDFCSTYDHEVVWKQTRKAGYTSLYTHLVEYEEWKNCSDTCTLVITGKLGSGKSVLLANIVDDLNLTTKKERPMVVYFFCRHDIPESLQARTILGSLARQLLRTVPDLGILSERCGDTYITRDADKILELILHGCPESHEAYIVVDGLDECDENERIVLVKALRRIQEKLNVLICASFRIEPNNGLQSMTRYLFTTRVVPLPEENPDIAAFIKADLMRCLDQGLLRIRDVTLIYDIEDALLAGSQGMFLWAALQIRSLCSMKTDFAIREALSDMPKDLSQTFSRILDKSGIPDRSLQTKTLQVVLAACQPLTVEELREALSVTPGDATWNPSKLLNDVHSALACCGCLLTVDEEESTVRVIHHSVKQYLLHGFDDVKREGFSFEDAQRTLADTIVTYLGYGVFETQLSRTRVRPIMAQSAPSSILQSTMGTSSATLQLAIKLLGSRKNPAFDLSKTLVEARGSRNPEPEHIFTFYTYAKTYWQDHIWYVSGQKDRIYQLSANLIQSRGSELKEADVNFGMQCMWPAKHGNTRIVNLLYQSIQDAEVKDRVWSPLMWAAEYGDHDALVALLDAGVDGDDKAITLSLPNSLIGIVMRGERDLVERLASFDKFDPNAKDNQNYTALMYASMRANMDIVKLLLSHKKTEVNGEPTGEWTPLLAAASLGHKDIVQLLLDCDRVDVNHKSKSGRSALMLAAHKGFKGTVEVLLANHKVDLLAQTPGGGETAYSLAMQTGHEEVAELLAERMIELSESMLTM